MPHGRAGALVTSYPADAVPQLRLTSAVAQLIVHSVQSENENSHRDAMFAIKTEKEKMFDRQPRGSTLF